MPAEEMTGSGSFLLKEFRLVSRSRKQRRLKGKLALEGPHLIAEALRAGLLPEAVFYTGRYRDLDAGALLAALPETARKCLLTPALFKQIARTETPREIAALVPFREEERLPAVEKNSLILLLDRLQDPGNMGAIIRTAAALDAAVYYTPGSVDPFSPKVLRSTAGAVFHLPLLYTRAPLELLAELKARGVQIVATVSSSGCNCWEEDYRCPTAFMIGNESVGLAGELISFADLQVTIPQPGWPHSLNAAVAAGIILYEVMRQRGDEKRRSKKGVEL